jgi:5-methylcytosine-specific restriction protein B
MGVKDSSRVQMIQFHQSYSYEDFIQGYRPNDQKGFELKNGIFYEFCKRAQRDPQNEYFFIIDEINRGNLSKIFGELLMLIENDKRGEEFSIPLTYSKSLDSKFYIPDNLYVIGTMNTADRSLALVDYALRRRFAFVNVQPEFGPKFQSYLMNKGASAQVVNNIVSKMSNLNSLIISDSSVGRGFEVGHSYFCSSTDSHNDVWISSIINNEVIPLITEYWFDNSSKTEQALQLLSE